MLKNYALERLKLPETVEIFKHRGIILPSTILGTTPVGYIDMCFKHHNGKLIQKLNINEFLQHHSASFGITRSGKSNGSGRLAEELLLKGIKICVVDYKGEFATVQELQGVRARVISVTGRDGKADAAELMGGTDSFILNLETITDTVYIPYLLDFFSELWQLQREAKNEADAGNGIIVPMKIFVDECQHYVGRIYPKEMPKELKLMTRNLRSIFRSIAQQGVGLGLPLHLITQRPTYLDPFIRNQCEVLMLYRQKWENDIDVYIEVLPIQGGGSKMRDARRQFIETMPTGTAYIVCSDGKLIEAPIKQKRSKDLSRTPGWAQQVEKMEAIRHEWQKNNIDGGFSEGEDA